ncbi:MAG: hypothetical protein P4M09_20695 [Devosia sp.]|nr:hypothetical protein [Devosia sp.]
MTDAELQRALDKLKATMISVATGGARIGEVESEFAATYDEVDEELRKRRIENVIPYRDLWGWYGRWSSGDLPSWQSRRSFVNGIFDTLQKALRRLPALSVEPTGWQRVDRGVTEIRNRLAEANSEETFQAVGLLCREVMISVAQSV